MLGGGAFTNGTVTARDSSTISHNTAVSASGLAQGGGLLAGSGSVVRWWYAIEATLRLERKHCWRRRVRRAT